MQTLASAANFVTRGLTLLQSSHCFLFRHICCTFALCQPGRQTSGNCQPVFRGGPYLCPITYTFEAHAGRKADYKDDTAPTRTAMLGILSILWPSRCVDRAEHLLKPLILLDSVGTTFAEYGQSSVAS